MNVDGIKCVRFEEKGGKIQERSKEKREGDEATFLSPAIQLKRLAKVGRKRPQGPSLVHASFSSSVDLCLLSNRRTGRLASKEFRVLSYASNLVILFFLNRLFAPPTNSRSLSNDPRKVFKRFTSVEGLFWKTGRDCNIMRLICGKWNST